MKEWIYIKNKYPKSFKEFIKHYTDNGSRGDIDLFEHTASNGSILYLWYWSDEGFPDYCSDSPYMANDVLYKFFDDNNIFISVKREVIGSDEWEFSYEIQYLHPKYEDAKRRCPLFEYINSFKEYGGSYIGAWEHRAVAEDNAFIKCFEIMEGFIG